MKSPLVTKVMEVCMNLKQRKVALNRAIEIVLAERKKEEKKVIDKISFPMEKASLRIKGSKLIITEELKHKLGIK